MMKKKKYLSLIFSLSFLLSLFTAQAELIDSQNRISNGSYQLVGVFCGDPKGERSYIKSSQLSSDNDPIIRTLSFDFSAKLLIANNKTMTFNMIVSTFSETIMKMSPSFSCHYNRIDEQYLDAFEGGKQGLFSSSGLKAKEGKIGIDCNRNGGIMPVGMLNSYLRRWEPIKGKFIYKTLNIPSLSSEGEVLALSFKNEEIMLKKGMCATKSGQDIDYDAFYLFKKTN
jgi:hypothetical protein